MAFLAERTSAARTWRTLRAMRESFCMRDVEVFAGDEAETRAGLGDGGEGVGLVADQGGKAEQRAGDGANGDDRLSGLQKSMVRVTSPLLRM
jgi:hypothetical protein